MNVLDTFSGIGGFSLGLERAGMRTIAFSEVDTFCCAVLAKRWPGVPNLGDIRTVTADRLGGLGRIDLVCGGYPCQPFSVAGARRAHEDDRHLWPELRRVIALARPSWVLCENVAGHISLGLDEVLSNLEGLGYTTRPFVIPACAAGAHHRRDRVWIVAHANGQGSQERFVHAGISSEARRDDDGQDTSMDTWWLAEPAVVRRPHGFPTRSHRIRALGNAVYPPLVERIGRAIMRSAVG